MCRHANNTITLSVTKPKAWSDHILKLQNTFLVQRYILESILLIQDWQKQIKLEVKTKQKYHVCLLQRQNKIHALTTNWFDSCSRSWAELKHMNGFNQNILRVASWFTEEWWVIVLGLCSQHCMCHCGIVWYCSLLGNSYRKCHHVTNQ